MEFLRQKHGNLASEMEILLTEVGSKFMPLPEERLLAVVHALLHRCYKYPIATTDMVPTPLKRELAGVCRACFSTDTTTKHSEFVQEYKKDFEENLDPDQHRETFPETLQALTEALKRWKTRLQNNVEDRLPAVLPLEEESRNLRDLRPLEIELPGQYLGVQEAHPETHSKLDYVGVDVLIVRRHGTSHRRLSLHGTDGREQQFLVQTSLTPAARSDERMVQLMRHLNRMLEKHKQTRRRHLMFHTPIIVPVWPQVRLLEEEASYSTFGEACEINCARYGREADVPITFFKESLNKVYSQEVRGEEVHMLRLNTYKEIIQSNYVSENVFSQFMYKLLPMGHHLWVFKKQFMSQMALSSMCSHMLHIGGRTPNKILFAKNSGKILQLDFHPMYDQSGNLEAAEYVPFRLTRNLQSFFTPYGIEGSFVTCLSSTALAFTAQHSPLEYHLTLFFRDELMTWPWRRLASGQSTPRRPELSAMVQTNVDAVVRRVNDLLPIVPAEDTTVLPARSVQKGVLDLVEKALEPQNICRMEATWHPWF